MSEHRQVHFFGKLPVKVTLHTWLHEVHPMREKAMNEGNPTLITSSDETNRKHATAPHSLMRAILLFLFGFFCISAQVKYVCEKVGPTEYDYRDREHK